MMSAGILICLFFNLASTHSTIDLSQISHGLKFVPKYERSLWEDHSLPMPVIAHDLVHIPRRNIQRRRMAVRGSEITPLYPGYGTHFAYVYVGTPPQRQSVIIDTGSQLTAFPCTGCSQCGQHTDEYWDLRNSSSAVIPKCNNQPCVISQSYSEGSSWRAFKVQDHVWVGGLTDESIPDADKYSVDFTFGCQTSETGLFRTQLADGIMGMSIAEDTLPFRLKEAGITQSKMFALCYRVGGGIMTLGGVDQRIHSKPTVNYAKLTKTIGWFTINIIDVKLLPRGPGGQQSEMGSSALSLGMGGTPFNAGKGTIVDSGTTDTYLPSSIAQKFGQLFKQIAGFDFSSANLALSSDQLNKIPDIVFLIEGTDGKEFHVTMPWTSYVDSVGGGKYAFRVYLSEGSGSVLGANFMNGYNVIFDPEGGKVGFVKSACKYEDYAIPVTRKPTLTPTRPPSLDVGSGEDSGPSSDPSLCAHEVRPLTECSADCTDSEAPAIVSGNQTWADRCGLEEGEIQIRSCHKSCALEKEVRGKNPFCYEKAWSECPKGCIQSRMVPLDKDASSSTCKYTQQTRLCYTGACALQDGDYLVFIDMRVKTDPRKWTYLYSEAFYGAFSSLFSIKESSIDLLNDASSEYTLGTKLHFQLRLRAKDFPSLLSLHQAAQSIPEQVWDSSFGSRLISALDSISQQRDGLDYSLFGWLKGSDIEILNAMALPIGDVRDPIDIPNEDGPVIINNIRSALSPYQLEFFLLGIALGSLSLFTCVCCLYVRLRQEHAALEKDKAMGGSLRKMWQKLSHIEKTTFSPGSSFGKGKSGENYRYREVQMSEMLPEDEEQGDNIPNA